MTGRRWLEPLRALGQRLLGIDPRALAVVRIGLALLLLGDLATRATDLTAHYTDVGILPRHARVTAFDMRADSKTRWWWSWHMASGTLAFQSALVFAAGVCALSLLLGYRTRLSTALSWMLLASLHSRLPVVVQGGDVLMRLLLFWSMFVPLGAVWSVDRACRRRSRRRWPATDPVPHPGATPYVTSVATAALLVQLALMYGFSALAKTGPAWHSDGTAIYYALHLDLYVTRLGRELLDYRHLLTFLTRFIWWLECLGPILVFVPWCTGPIRIVTAAAFVVFHVGLALCLKLGLFPYVAIVAWCMFLPAAVWDRVQRALAIGIWSDRVRRMPRAVRRMLRPAAPAWRLSRLEQLAVALLLGYVLLWNSLLVYYGQYAGWPAWFERPAQLLRLEQHWTMFAPQPPRDDGWLVMRGVLENGAEVNLWAPGAPLRRAKPELGSSAFPNHRWRKYLSDYRWRRDPELLSCLSDWLRWRWNTLYSGGQEARRVRLVEITFWLEESPPPGAAPRAAQPERLWSWDYRAAAPGEPFPADS